MCPKTLAILADSPAFALELAVAARRGESFCGQSRRLILFCVKTRKVMADDFRVVVPLEAPCSSVPTRHDAVGVKHIDRVIRHRIDQEAIPSVKLLHLLAQFLSLSLARPGEIESG